MQDTITIQANDTIDCSPEQPEQLANMSDIELLEYVRRCASPTANRTDIAHDHRRFLHRHELERLAQLVQRMQTR